MPTLPTLALLAAMTVVAEPTQDATDPVAIALQRFRAAEPEIQQQIVDQIRDQIDQCTDPSVLALLKLRDTARKGLKVLPPRSPVYFEHTEYAPTQAARSFVEAGSDAENREYDTMRPWESAPGYLTQTVRYSYADDVAYETGFELTPEHYLQDYLSGYVPGNDVLVAWLESTFDHDKKLNKIADHFDHVYCDRVGNCYEPITIYDAFASTAAVEMSDIDVIAFARNIRKDKSFASPIPTNSKLQRLYDDHRDSFLLYFRHRTLCEAAARIFANPDAWLRAEHEGLRHRLWYIYSIDKSDPDKVRRRMVKSKDRDTLIDDIDAIIDRDKEMEAKRNRWAADRNADRWKVAEITYGVLRTHGLMPR